MYTVGNNQGHKFAQTIKKNQMMKKNKKKMNRTMMKKNKKKMNRTMMTMKGKPEPVLKSLFTGDEQAYDDDEEKWIKHYSSNHEILLIGDGDFSFSLCLATCFGSAANIVATSLHSYERVIEMYKEAKSNLDNLNKLGANILHGVDATKMKLHTDLKMRKFDRIIFNFPHAGFHGKEDNAVLIRMHVKLVNGFFQNARSMLRANGEIHLNHKTTAPFCYWDLEGVGSENSLVLTQCVDFKKEDYPGYNNKRGDGLRCDEPFPLGESSTFKFCFSATMAKKLSKRRQVRVNSIPVCYSQAGFPIRMPPPLLYHHQPDLRYLLPTDFTRVRSNPVPTYHSQAAFPVGIPPPRLYCHQLDLGHSLPTDYTRFPPNPVPTYQSRVESPVGIKQPLSYYHQPDLRYPLPTDFTRVSPKPVPTYHSWTEFPIRLPPPLSYHDQPDLRYPLSTDFNRNTPIAVPTYHSQAEFPIRMPQPLFNQHQPDFGYPLATDFSQARTNQVPPLYQPQPDSPIRMPKQLLNHHQQDFRYRLQTDSNHYHMNADSYGKRVEIDRRRIFSEYYFTNAMDSFGRKDGVNDVVYSVHDELNWGCARFDSERRDPNELMYLYSDGTGRASSS